MVSFHQTPILLNQTKTTRELDHHHQEKPIISKKRKWEDEEVEENSKIRLLKKSSIFKKTNIFCNVEFELEKPLPLEWQRCLDIQSGQVYYYNTRTQRRTSKDPRQKPHHMSLELELNLPYDRSIEPNVDDNWTNELSTKNYEQKPKNSSVSSSWTTSNFEVDHKEMVAAVCMRCHMLVMLCKATPSCPNCKFIYPSEHTPNLQSSNNKHLKLGVLKS